MDETPTTSTRKRPLELAPGGSEGTDDSQARKKTAPTPLSPKQKRSAVMNNELILAKIASKMPVPDLWDLRNSCLIWNTAFIPNLREKQNWMELNSNSGSTIDLLQVIQSSRENPFTSYCVDLDSRGDGIQAPDRGCFPNFVLAVGNSITKLELIWKRATDLSVNDLRKIIFDWTPQLTKLDLKSCDHETPSIMSNFCSPIKVLPKLKDIVVRLRVEENLDWLNAAFAQLMSDVIQAAEGLETLYLSDDSDNYGFMEPIISELLQNTTTRSHIHKLKNLELNTFRSTHLPNSVLQHLLDLATGAVGNPSTLRLKSFFIGVLCWKEPGRENEISENFRLIRAFLATQAQTLTELEVEFGWFSGRVPLTPCHLPPMNQLKKLKLHHTGLGPREIQFGDTSTGKMLATFPQIKRFSCQYAPRPDAERPLKNVLGRYHHVGVKELDLSLGSNTIVTWKDFTSLGNVFPSLTRLALTFSSEWNPSDESQDDKDDNDNDNSFLFDIKQFSKIWTTWPALTVIHICWKVADLDLDLDALLTGIPRKKLDQLRLEHLSLFPGLEAPADNGPLDLDSLRLRGVLVKYYKSRPGIADLEQLKDFIVIFDDNACGKGNSLKFHPKLTDMGGYCGIGMASSTLQRIFIQGAGKNLVSAQCLAFIRDKFGLLAEISL